MSEASTDLDRNERATSHKLEKAHQRGAVARSASFTTSAGAWRIGSVLKPPDFAVPLAPWL